MTAKELFDEKFKTGLVMDEDLHQYAIKFAKYHVKLALKKAADEATLTNDSYISAQEGTSMDIDIDSILNAYPENLII